MRSGHFNSEIIGYDNEGMPQFDRAQDAEFFALFFKLFFRNGVYPNPSTNFQVLASEGLKVIVNPGQGMIEGYFCEETEQRELALQASNSVLDRIDRVVLRLDLQKRLIDLYILEGTPASVPEAPNLTRPINGESGDIYELALADIFITKNSTKVSQARITDQRLNRELCGIVEQLVDGIDTTAYHTQLNALLKESKINLEAFMETVQGILGEDAAGNLLNLISAINTQYEVIVPIEGWVLNSTTNLYELTISNALAHEYTKKPTWGLVNVETTAEGIEAEETAFAVIKTAGFSEGTILLTATEVPETSVTIIVTVL